MVLALLVGCAPDLTLYSTKGPELAVEEMDNLVVEDFTDELGQPLEGPAQPGLLKANQPLAAQVRAQVLAELSKGGDFRLIPPSGLQGRLPEAGKTALLKGRVRYYELDAQGADKVFYVLLAKKKGLDSAADLLGAAAGSGIAALAESQGKGFVVPTPYQERAGALEVTFELVRASDQSALVAPQALGVYWHQKWGGKPELSVLSPPLVQGFENLGLKNPGLFAQADEIAQRMALKQQNPEEYLAKGYHLNQDDQVPLLAADVRSLLSQELGERFVRRISRHTVPFALNVSGGDGQASVLIKAGAFNQAINRLESLPQPLGSDDLYNLGVAYEAMGEVSNAKRQFQKGLDQDPKNQRFLEALARQSLQSGQ
ncbi:MAG: hypothetical protein A2600_01365 [Candidatus Lambdaproteobacteria bacterium RIFOXYD1_FULL_56_27]|uniref:Uncharacterized protein n=1 Tax=Candidatus Lambdaproteobacteria bacterium RIFOXYD2_FULL_56_26 TaxID=1817773 RepID=A0A1F6GSN4_9PROT|nr:MAG: hypothetical protein A2557_00480 [Candidatus Lambdaproteobacteria bacterium RIFOXYD2_FULL_56_26]OGH01383.1 MAG: hypothetical protein A2426_13315 [Candidatus Lambdaproteobacteria bacterium RIFOXYC1_FULL_56_13]OGH06924.1 MAG: hypothetical protein A2600_01365 [Candidatus Lambdaproteobacteria bacterium RIFOXYD1_FULL_56_27]